MEAIDPAAELSVANNLARPMIHKDVPDVLKLDREVFDADRRIVLEWMLEEAPEYAWVAYRNGRLSGYTFGRHGFAFEHIGPVVAEDLESARHLLTVCLANRGGSAHYSGRAMPRFRLAVVA